MTRNSSRRPTKKSKKSKKVKRSTLRRKADKLWSKIIRTAGKCEICGSDRNLNAHHLISRQFNCHRYDLKNGICLCSKCHTFDRYMSAHKGYLLFVLWMQENKPKQYEWWVRHSKSIQTKYRIDYKATIEYLEKELHKRE